MTTAAPTSVHVRWMIRRDMPEVLAIEQEAFPDSPWTEDEFSRHLRQRNTIGMVADDGRRVVGFMIYSLERTRIYVHNLAVGRAWRRGGVGRAMADALKKKVSCRRPRLILDVSEPNLAAQCFFRACGFRAVAILHGFERATGGDAYRFVYANLPLRQPAACGEA